MRFFNVPFLRRRRAILEAALSRGVGWRRGLLARSLVHTKPWSRLPAPNAPVRITKNPPAAARPGKDHSLPPYATLVPIPGTSSGVFSGTALWPCSGQDGSTRPSSGAPLVSRGLGREQSTPAANCGQVTFGHHDTIWAAAPGRIGECVKIIRHYCHLQADALYCTNCNIRQPGPDMGGEGWRATPLSLVSEAVSSLSPGLYGVLPAVEPPDQGDTPCVQENTAC